MTENILMRRAPANGQAQEPASEDRPAAAAPASAFGHGPVNILIVDDEPKNLTVLETVLDDPGYRLVRAGSADQALLALIAEEFALIILDIRLPDMTGFELAQLIKQRKKTSRVPIIFLTAYYNEDQHVLEGYEAGVVDYLHKPVNAAILRAKVAVFAELHGKNRALRAEVTERRRAEAQLRELNKTLEHRVSERMEALRASEARLRHAADAAGLTYVAIDYAHDRVVTAENFAAAMGYAPPPGEGVDTEAGLRFLLDPVVPSDRLRVAAAFQEFLGGECRGKVDYSVIGDDRIERRIESMWATELGPDGKPLRAFVTNLDITERKRAEAHAELLMGEVNHRAKNVLAVVQAVARQTARNADPATFVARLSERIDGLAASHDLLVRNQWQGVEVSDLVEAQLAHFKDLIGTRVLLDGAPARLTPAAAQAIGMALHELGTNAAKHGALSNQAGRVRISWRVTVAKAATFTIQWLEEGGPEVAAPTRNGFGQTVIGPAAEAVVKGTVEIDYRESGIYWKLSAPVANALERGPRP